MLQKFKDMMSLTAQTVFVVTTKDEAGAYCGVTISSVTSLTVKPPMILICLHNHSRIFNAVSYSKQFAINLLSDQQQSIAEQFASSVDDRFAGIELFTHNSLPLIAGCLSAMEVELSNIYIEGDHAIITGVVTDIFISDEVTHANLKAKPLIYHKRNFCTL